MGVLNPPTLSWRRVDQVVLLAFTALVMWYGALGYLRKPGERIRGSDSIGYYVYLPSIFMDGDLNLADDFRRLGGEEVFLFPAPNGRTGNPYSVGPAILWAPWFAVGHVVAWAGDSPTDGYSSPYQFAVYWGNVLYVLLGLLLTIRLLKTFGLSPSTCLAGTLSILLLTQLTYYILPKSATSHGISFASVAAFALAIRTEGLTWKSGLLGGITVLVRWQNILFIPILAAADHVSRNGRIDIEQIKRSVPFAIAAAVAILPQMIIWQLIYDRPFLVPQLEGYVDLTRLPTLQVLFSLQHGLITWHPWWLLAGLGMLLLAERHFAWTVAVGVCFVLQLYINGTVLDWWGSWSFGHRRFVNLLPLLGICFGFLYSELQQKHKAALLGVMVGLGLWNQAFVYQYQNGLIPRSNAPTSTEFVEDKFSLSQVNQAQLAVNTAVQSFRRNDFENFLHFAREAHTAYPGYRSTVKVHSVASAVEGKLGEALEGYDKWLEIEPNNKVAIWGLADIRLKLGQAGQARELMDSIGIIDAQTAPVLDVGKGTLLTPSFFDAYRKELDKIYTE
jgi:hypothetical protein